MPPRAITATCGSLFNLTSLLRALPEASQRQAYTQCSACLFSTTSPQLAKGKKKARKHVDPYRAAQAQQRKVANLARQKVLQAERLAAMGDPVRSRPTPFLESLRSPSSATGASAGTYLNFFVKPDDLHKSVEYSKWLTEPFPKSDASGNHDPQDFQARQEIYEKEHENASRALQAITALENGSSQDRTRANIQRCIEEFGRHATDNFLPPKPASSQSARAAVAEGDGSVAAAGDVISEGSVPKRVGPDTGSAEVQVAILTTKINVLADNLGKKDKHNKRNLRLLVHKRQKLLKYLRRKERGGPRWQHLMDKLGLGDAMWKGEISL